jgi:hypothetical protein
MSLKYQTYIFVQRMFPPRDSTYWIHYLDLDPYEMLEPDIAKISAGRGEIILIGDFNARTGRKP